GGFYQQAKPAVNMCYPPLQWQTYDIEFKAARFEGNKKVSNALVTVRHNGGLIHNRLELKHETPGGPKEAGERRPRQPAGPGNPMQFRNIWVVDISGEKKEKN